MRGKASEGENKTRRKEVSLKKGPRRRGKTVSSLTRRSGRRAVRCAGEERHQSESVSRKREAGKKEGPLTSRTRAVDSNCDSSRCVGLPNTMWALASRTMKSLVWVSVPRWFLLPETKRCGGGGGGDASAMGERAPERVEAKETRYDLHVNLPLDPLSPFTTDPTSIPAVLLPPPLLSLVLDIDLHPSLFLERESFLVLDLPG